MLLTDLLTHALQKKKKSESYLVTGDFGEIFTELKAWCDEQDVVLLSFGEDSIRIYGKDDAPMKTVPFDHAEYAETNEPLQLPHEVHNVLLGQKCVFYYENLLNMEQSVQNDYFDGLILTKPLMSYNTASVVAHVAAKTPAQSIPGHKRMKYFLFSFCVKEPNSDTWDMDDMSRSEIVKYLNTDSFVPDIEETTDSFADAGIQYMTVSPDIEEEWKRASVNAFQKALQDFMDKRNLKSQSALERRFGIGHPTMIKWFSPRNPVYPQKKNLLRALVNANCTYEEATKLLSAAGYQWTDEKSDKIFQQYFQNKKRNGWDQQDLKETLEQHGCPVDFLE